MKSYAKLLSALCMCCLCALSTFGQYYDDDDLYYSPAHAAEREAAAAAARAREAARKAVADSLAAQALGLGASDTYTSGSAKPLMMDVDSYNRRNVSTSGAQQEQANDFSYTRRIERFHNPDVVTQSGDTALMEYYYNTPSEKDINVYIINNIDPLVGSPVVVPSYLSRYGGWYNFDPWNFGWSSPYWSYSLSYDPWYGGWSWGSSWAWGPSWSWGFGWRPYWAWTPGWGYPWGWGGAWGPAWGAPLPPHINSGNWVHNPSGAMRPHRPATGSGSAHAGTAGMRPGQSVSRPGNFGRPGNTVATPSGNYRPGYTPGQGAGSYNPSNNDRRGRNNNSGTYINTNTTNRNQTTTRSNYNNNSSRGNYNSGGSYRSGGSGSRSTGGGTGGGSHSSGGGGSRGRGRGR